MRQSAFAQDDCKTAAEVWARAERVQQLRRAGSVPRAIPVAPKLPLPSSPRLLLPAPVPPPSRIVPLRPALMIAGSMAELLEVVGTYFGVTRAEIFSQSRKAALTNVRQVAMYVAQKATTKSLPEIGRALQRDHTTVLHGQRKIEALLAGGNVEMAAAVKDIMAELDRRRISQPARQALEDEPPPFPPNEGKAWTSIAERSLVHMYVTEGRCAYEIAELMGRSAGAIQTKIKKLRIRAHKTRGPKRKAA